MSGPSFRVQHLDHVEVLVPDRYEAAAWYKRVFGLEIVAEFEFWAKGEGGPLMVACADGQSKLALFTGVAQADHSPAGHDRVAFGVSGEQFLNFVRESGDLPLHRDGGDRASGLKPVDHERSWSVYFCDPYGNRFEVTTYDYDAVQAGLA